jgi:FtsX-like permease family
LSIDAAATRRHPFCPQEDLLPTTLGLWPTVLRRGRADWPVLLASWALLASALSLLAAGTLYTQAVTLAGLHRELRSAAPVDRSIVVRTKILPDRLSAADAAITPELEGALAPVGGELVRVLRSSSYAEASADPATVTDLEIFASYEGIDGHAALVDGRWAEAGRTPVEVTLSEAAARELDVGTGDPLSLVSRLDPSRTKDVVVVGTWRPDPADPYWLGEPLALEGTERGGRYTTRGPLVVAADDLISGPLAEPLDAQWRAIPDIEGFRPDTLDEVAADVAGLPGRINAALPGSNQATVATKLPTILASVDRSVLVAQAGILLLLIQFGVLAVYAVVLVAALMQERRRTETALLRARGAGLGHLIAMSLGEALLVVVPAAILAPWLAAVLVLAVRLNPALESVGLGTPLPGPETYAVAAIGGCIALFALTLPTVASSVSIAGVRAAVGRQAGRTLPQRLGLDLALVVLAGLALLQLRLYGATLTRNARGTLGVDPLLVAAPAIGLLGGAVLAIRIVPRLAELGERLLSRGRGLVGALGGRQIARRPLRYTRAALLLILAAALGTFASAHAATWTQSQADQAAYAAGADIRLQPGTADAVPSWALGTALRSITGVTAATPVVKASVDLGSSLRDGAVAAVDGAAMADVVRLRDDASGEATRAALRALGERRPTPPGVPVPDGARRLSLTIDSSFQPVEGFAIVPDGFEGISASVVVVDGDGRVARIRGEPGPLGVAGARLIIPLTAGDGAGAVTGPVRIVAVELDLSVASLENVVLQGAIAVNSFAASPDESGDSWTPLDLTVAGPGRWTADIGGNVSNLNPAPGSVVLLPVDSVFSGNRASWQLSFAPVRAEPVPALAGPAFLAQAAAGVGDQLHATMFGIPVALDLIGAVDAFPPLDQSRPFLVVDGLSLDLARLAAHASIAETDEWWLAVEPGSSAGVAAAVRLPPVAAASVVDRSAVLADLTTDPLGLAVIGILGLGSAAALLFAAVGFLVSSTVSTTERLGEFALLKALGLSPRQLLAWLSMESLALLAVGLVAGTALGLLLAWLALPFATLTASGAPPVPAPVIIVPPDSVLPTLGLAVVLVVATVLLIRRQLPSARTSAVLRARDE